MRHQGKSCEIIQSIRSMLPRQLSIVVKSLERSNTGSLRAHLCPVISMAVP